MKNIISSIYDVIFPKCPSGLPHRIGLIGTFTNINGREYCSHKDCWKANLADAQNHICVFKEIPGGYNQIHERCDGCGKQRLKSSSGEGWKRFPNEKPKDNQNVNFQVKTDGVMDKKVLGGWYCEQSGSFHTPGNAFNAHCWKEMEEPPEQPNL